jgi:Uma2 family endonuclease
LRVEGKTLQVETNAEGGAMSLTRTALKSREIDYPTSDGRPMAETDLHRDLMVELIETLQTRYASDKMAYVSGNLLVYYERGNRRRHVAPDVFVVKGVRKRKREYYLLWKEAKGLDLAIELTSKSTRKEDLVVKKALYRDVLKVREYFLFDPRAEYLKPALQGFRLENGDYVQIEPVDGRLPSEVLGLHLEAHGAELRLWDPATGRWLPTNQELKKQQKAEKAKIKLELEREKRARAKAERKQVKEKQQRIKAERERSKAEQERIKAEQDQLKEKQQRIEVEQERIKAEQERIKAEQERIKAEQERDREAEARRLAEAEIARLRAQLTRDQGKS